MARPHIEFIQSQAVPWAEPAYAPEFHGAQAKLLSIDPGPISYTALVRVPSQWVGPRGACDRMLEIYVLHGGLVVDGTAHPRHTYVYWPAGRELSGLEAPHGAELIVFADHRHDPIAAASATVDPFVVEAASEPWDVSTYDPKLTHLALARKVLRIGPGETSRTYLLTGLPHGYPRGGELQIESHPHAEEMFLICGEMSCEYGVMTTGAYFYRPAEVWHGLHASEFGFLMVLRSPGAGRVVTTWSDERRAVPVDPRFRPILPPDAPEVLRRPRPVRPEY